MHIPTWSAESVQGARCLEMHSQLAPAAKWRSIRIAQSRGCPHWAIR